MTNLNDLRAALAEIHSDFKSDIPECGGCIYFSNTPKRGERKYFTLSFDAFSATLGDILRNREVFLAQAKYQEKSWRVLGDVFFKDFTARTLINVQTKPFFSILNKLIHIASERDHSLYNENVITMQPEDLKAAIVLLRGLSAPTI